MKRISTNGINRKLKYSNKGNWNATLYRWHIQFNGKKDSGEILFKTIILFV
jgi:hypothetical protein